MKTKRSKIPLYQSPNRLVGGLSVSVSAITNVTAVSMMAKMYGSGRYRLTRRTKNSFTRRIPTSSCSASCVTACGLLLTMARPPSSENLRRRSRRPCPGYLTRSTHAVGKDLNLEVGVFETQVREGLARLEQLPLLLPLEGFLLILKTPFLEHVGANAEDHVPAGLGDPDQIVEGLGRGVSRGEDARGDDCPESVVGEVQPPSQLHLAQVLVHTFVAGEF